MHPRTTTANPDLSVAAQNHHIFSTEIQSIFGDANLFIIDDDTVLICSTGSGTWTMFVSTGMLHPELLTFIKESNHVTVDWRIINAAAVYPEVGKFRPHGSDTAVDISMSLRSVSWGSCTRESMLKVAE